MDLPSPQAGSRRRRGATVVKGSPLRGIGPERQRDAKAAKSGLRHWRREIEQAKSRADDQLLGKRGDLYQALRHARPVKRANIKHVRKEGLKNLRSVLGVLVGHSEFETGFIGDGRHQHRRWSVADLDYRAFGDLVDCERSDKRTWRWLAVLEAAGCLVTHRIAHTEDGETYRADVAIRCLTRRFYSLIGLGGAVKAAAIHADRARAVATRPALVALPGAPAPARGPINVGQWLAAPVPARSQIAPAPPDRPPRPVSQPATPTAAAEIEKLKDLFGIG